MAEFDKVFQKPPGSLETITFKTQVGPALSQLSKYLSHQYGKRFAEIINESNKLKKIDSEKTNKQAVSLTGKASKLEKELEGERIHLTKPLLSFKGGVDSQFKEYTQKLVVVGNGLRGLITAYQNRIELERRMAEKAAADEAAKLQAEIDKDAKEAGVEAPQVVTPVVPPTPTVTRTDEGTASVIKTWSFEVEDLGKVPREYLGLDDRKVNNAIRGGVRNIPGLRIFEKSQVRVRT